MIRMHAFSFELLQPHDLTHIAHCGYRPLHAPCTIDDAICVPDSHGDGCEELADISFLHGESSDAARHW